MQVKCSLKEDHGKVLASAVGADEGKDGYAISTLLLKGEPGTTYDVQARHLVVPLLSEPQSLLAAPEGAVSWLTDPFHFGAFAASSEVYTNSEVMYRGGIEGQVARTRDAEREQAEARAFAVLFRRINLFERMGREAKSPDEMEARPRFVLPTELGLTDAEAHELRRVAELWEQERRPFHEEGRRISERFRSTFPGGAVRLVDDPTPPASLTALQQRMDDATLRSVTALRNGMTEVTFQQVSEKVRTMFSSHLVATPE